MAEKKYMDNTAFQELKGALKEALEYERGERNDLRTTTLQIVGPPAPMSKTKIVALRKSRGCSQDMFARALNVSKRTVQSWEQGSRAPSDAALRLLEIIDRNPEVLIEPARKRKVRANTEKLATAL